jgi:dTDP-4-dehydrorhamnose reductase
MKILLFGKGGQVGWELQRSLAPLGEVVALDSEGRAACAAISPISPAWPRPSGGAPDVIVNAAAHTAVDKAESEPELARTINALAPGVLADEAAEARRLAGPLLDRLRLRRQRHALAESDPTGPLGVYGQTKLEGEQAVAVVRGT